MNETYEEIIKKYDEPVFRFKPRGDFTEKEILHTPVPEEILVVRIDHPTEFMVYSRFNRTNDEWHVNTGERFVIRELLLEKKAGNE